MEKQTNPKDAIGSNKLPLHLWPTTATAMGTIGLANGMLKYGRANWRKVGVRASIYYDACMRHLQAWWEGEENDPDDGVPHLGAALACLAIIVDAKAADKLNDDRAFNGAGYRRLVSELTPHVERLKAHHEGRKPKHYSIGDDQVGEMTAAPDADGWIEWNGGDCPVGDGVPVDVKFRDGKVFDASPDYGYRWNHIGAGGDIVAYRVSRL